MALTQTQVFQSHHPTTRQGEAMHKRIYEGLSTAVAVLDANFTVLSINPAGEMLFAISANRLIGKKFMPLFQDSMPIIATLEEALARKNSITLRELKIPLLGHDAITVDMTVGPLTNPEGDTNLLIELVHVDRYLRLSREDDILDRHSATQAMLKGLAHEIKNPLGGLSGAAQLLEKQLPDRSLKEYTYIIVKEADRLRNLVDRMFASSKPLNKDRVNIHEILGHVRKVTLAENHDGQLDIMQDYDPSLPEFVGDNDQLIQAVLNIVKNAVEALKGTGRIILRTRIERQFTIGNRRHRLVLKVEIEDNGPGIPDKLKEQVFYPMVTSRAEGTGLGLSLAQSIINSHDGLIEFKSRPGKTIFTILLPILKSTS
jgi:two-component system nitrogen regulation sensor histidine kinase GlnL